MARAFGLPCFFLAGLAACAAPRNGGEAASPDAEALLCPELGGNSDPLEANYADTPEANAQIRAFVAAARGLSDVTLEIERRAIDTCRRIRKDIGAPDAPVNAPIDTQCEPVRAAIEKLLKEGVELRIAIAPPRCEDDGARKGRCNSVAGSAGAEAGVLCESQSLVYARCTLPAVSFASSRNADEVVRLGRSLEENLPPMLYADMALGRRLVSNVEQIAVASAKLTSQLKNVGPHGAACVGLAGAVTAKAAERLRVFLAASGALVLSLDPEIVSSAKGPS
ncbi:MAG: hypothetical protein KIT84_39850 [Labilithrix sp.]|nr:hypothetical protein [Labilithrix sp.]MCW5817219.1 hypothetical protein [Labilithrix sp.]